MQDAITQIENFIQGYRDTTLVANVNADLQTFALISSDFMNGLTDNLEAGWILNSIRDFNQLQADINAGNMTDAYTLGPAYNLLGMSFVAGMKAIGIQTPANAYPQSQLDFYLSQMVTTDYALVGGVTVNMDVSCSVVGPMSSGVGGNDLFQWTQGGKKMWPKYSKNYYSPDGATYVCDFTKACNTLSSALACCQTCLHGCSPITLPPSVAATALNLLIADREAFLADSSVETVRTGMLGATSALNPSLSVITDKVPTASCQGHVDF
jgi:hypothetical protein